VEIRPAIDGDLAGVNDVYNHYVRTHHATFDVEPISLDARREWASHFGVTGRHRLLVAVDGATVLGYATSSVFRDRSAYDRTVETSVYIAPDATGRGIGRAMYGALFAALDGEDVHRAIAGIAVPNPLSVALHERVGFTKVGHLTEVGWKFDRWWDVAWYEKPLG
jgi:phosphinothricin acetyltransferase